MVRASLLVWITLGGASHMAAQPSGYVRSDFWETTFRQTAGEQRYLGWARILDGTFRLTDQQKQQVLQAANRNGIPGCIEQTDAYFRNGETPPDLVYKRGDPVSVCSWYFQYFMEQVFALITPEQRAGKQTSYENFRREVTGGRTVLEARAAGR